MTDENLPPPCQRPWGIYGRCIDVLLELCFSSLSTHHVVGLLIEMREVIARTLASEKHSLSTPGTRKDVSASGSTRTERQAGGRLIQ